MANGPTSHQWRDAANALREQAAKFDRYADESHRICGVVCNCGPKGEPLACGYEPDHGGAHAWATLPTFTSEAQVV